MLLEVKDLNVRFATHDGEVKAVNGIDLDVGRGEAVGLVGESGCGKSVTWLAALGLLPGMAQVTGSVRIEGRELIGARVSEMEAVRGARIAMIFQDPSSSLNPVHRVGRQIAESLRLHRGLRGAQARAEAIRSQASRARPQWERPVAFKCEICTGSPASRPTARASSMDLSRPPPSSRIWLA